MGVETKNLYGLCEEWGGECTYCLACRLLGVLAASSTELLRPGGDILPTVLSL